MTPEDYAETSFLARFVAKEMFARLAWMKLEPQQIIDVGCGLGMDLPTLAERYPKARLCGMDLAQSFLHDGRQRQQGSWGWVVADGHTLPLRSHSVDLIFVNLLLPWVKHPAAFLQEWRRILRPEGLLLFSCLGPDTFKEWKTQDDAGFLPGLVDLHNVGDALLEEGFVDPVLEVDSLTLTYRSQEAGQNELEKSGMRQAGGPKLVWPSHEGLFPVTFEVVYGHAFSPLAKGFKSDDQGVVRIPVSHLGSSYK